MKVKINSTLIFRTPKFSYLAELVDCWDELKEAIAISSTSFYETIKDINADQLESLPSKIYFTIWKYFNRAKFRSTPYGTFASFTILENALKQSEERIVIGKSEKLTQLLDWSLKNTINLSINDLLKNNCVLFSNSSYYLTPQSCRYIACTDGVFELAEIERDPFVLQILETCLAPIRVNDLIAQLTLDVNAVAELYELLQDMHELQLIFTNYDPNIIGEDYFDRVAISADPFTPTYIIAERNAAGGLNNQILKAVPDLVDFLQNIIPSGEQAALNQFIKNFKRKFDDKEIPLMLALDPEIGVGYDELEQAGENDDFIAHLNKKKIRDNVTDDLKSLLALQLLPQRFKSVNPIFLNKLPLKPIEKVKPLPNSISMVLSVVDDLIFIDQIGGTTANALNGRFTMANSKVEAYCNDIAAKEQEANMDVLLFDVAYMAETAADNINRRKLVYDHQLSILNYDTSKDPLTLNDIQISIRGTEIILRSKKLNKRIVPKMASAYNYTRSDLSVFRLLCDLQHQHLQTSLSISLDSLFPNLDYYPRLQYQNIVLNAAKWRLEKQSLIDANQQFFNVADCKSYLSSLGVQGCFRTGISDQTLCFNIENDDDIAMFLQYMQKQNSIYLEEVVLPKENIVNDQNGAPYMAQFILNLYHQNKVYNSIVEQQQTFAVQEVFPPGKEWLYFEIFCHQQRSDQILAEIISPFVTAQHQFIKSWFFIRYNENGNHIRFRIQLHNEQDGQKIISLLINNLENYLTAGLISDIQLKTYKRELNRYGAELITVVEEHFCSDSMYVFSILEAQYDNFSKYRLCSELVWQIKAAGVFSTEKLTKVVQYMSDAFNNEHQLEATDFKKINTQYQLFKKLENIPLAEHQEVRFKKFTESFISTLNCARQDKQAKLFSDLLHMHVNRLFNTHQRTHEMMLYYFILKDIQRLKAMKN